MCVHPQAAHPAGDGRHTLFSAARFSCQIVHRHNIQGTTNLHIAGIAPSISAALSGRMMLHLSVHQPRLLVSGSPMQPCHPGLVQRVRPTRVVVRRRGVQAVAEPMQQRNSGAPSAPASAPKGEWGPTSWRNFKAMQQPVYPDQVGSGRKLLHVLGAVASRVD